MVRASIRSLLLLLLFVATPSAAQQPDAARFERALSAIRDTTTLGTMARERQGDASTTVQIELALIDLRRWELTGDKRDADRAREAFERVREREPDNAWGHFGWGLAVAHGPDVRADTIMLAATGRSWSRTLGLDAASRARRSLERALQLDPGFPRAAEVLGELALATRSPEALRDAKQALVAATVKRRDTPRTLLMMSRVDLALGETESAIASAEAAAGEREPDALHALAIAMLTASGREQEGARAFFAAIDALTPELAHRIWAEMSAVADSSEFRIWAGADLDGRKALLRKFWDVRAGMSGVSVPERLAEHYQRLAVAMQRYVRVAQGPFPQYAINQKWPALPLDERGVIYLRHGEPRAVIRTPPMHGPGSSMCSELPLQAPLGTVDGRYRARTIVQRQTDDNESWVYTAEDGTNRLFNFVRCAGFTEFMIPWEVPCGSEWANDRKAYEMDVRWCGGETRERIRDYTRLAFRTDSHRPKFEAAVPFAYDLLAFRGANGATDLSAPIAVRADSVRPDTLSNGELAYRMALSMFIVDTIAAAISRSDTMTFYRTTRAPARDEIIVAYINLTVAPAEDAVLRFVVRDGGRPARGQLHGAHIRVPSYAGDSLMISSIALGVPGEGGNWRRGATSLTVMPIGEFSGGTFRAFYEIYNLPAGTRYRTELTVFPESGNAQANAVVQLQFEDLAQPGGDGVIQELRSVETNLAPGDYRLFARIINLDSRAAATSERQFRVVRPRGS